MAGKIAEELGRLFEVGFNIGILACIQKNQIKHKFGNLYLKDLQELKLPKILREIANKTTSSVQREIAEKWTLFFLQKGFLAGLNFFQEYLKAAGWTEKRLRYLEISYYQCSFWGDNSIGTVLKTEQVWQGQLLGQFEQLDAKQIETTIAKYFNAKGEFLKADTLMLLQYKQKEVRVLSVDLSVFSGYSEQQIEDLSFVDILRKQLNRDIKYLRSKSFFSKLRIDTQNLGVEFSEDLKTYFKLFKIKDKETSKLIQAASYAYSFYGFLQENNGT